MSYTTDIELLKEHFANKEELSVDDIFQFYKIEEPEIPRTTVNWRIYNFVHNGQLQRVGRGSYKIGKTTIFKPALSHKIEKIAKSVKKNFPYINFCVWELSDINRFTQHLINFNIYFVDVERDAVDAVYYNLKENNSNVMNIKNIFDDLSDWPNYIFVRPLISHAPLHEINNMPTITLEKILVDLFSDKEFVSFQGSEIYSIFSNAIELYTVNESALLRYASRKKEKDKIQDLLNTIKRQ